MYAIGDTQTYHGKTATEIELVEYVLAFNKVCPEAWDMALARSRVYGMTVIFNDELFKLKQTSSGLDITEIIALDGGNDLSESYGYKKYSEPKERSYIQELDWKLDDYSLDPMERMEILEECLRNQEWDQLDDIEHDEPVFIPSQFQG